MTVHSLHVTGLKLGGWILDATERVTITILGHDLSWKATLCVLEMPALVEA